MNQRHPVLSAVDTFLDSLPGHPETGLLISLSGGIDSVALLAAVAEVNHTRDVPRPIESFHLHHGLRGEEADRDAAHCLQLCRRWSVPLHIVHENLDLQWGDGKPSMETVARNRRRFHFEKIAHARNCSHILLGHHIEDQAETLLGNLLRGSGLRGLAGIHPLTPLGASGLTVARPLLECRKAELADFLQSRSLKAVEDSTNTSLHHRRNRIRHRWIPLLEEESPELISHLHHLSVEMRERWYQSERKLKPLQGRLFIRNGFTSFPPETWESLADHETTDLFRESLRGDGGSGQQLDRKHLHQLLLLTRGENMAETELPGQRVARRCGGWIHVSPKSSSVPELWNPVMTDTTQNLLHLGLQWEVDHPTPLLLRRWSEEDRWPGRVTRSLESLRLTGIPAELRPLWPVFENPDSGEVTGSPGICGPQARLTPVESTKLDALGFHLLRVTQP
ncbi:MAG: tRNA lysidine(34) synthetase TilS [Planctomycetes bacterium]|nr:tRNA lysidine(34) synthetase TilS [Planctomycetota bacterium]